MERCTAKSKRTGEQCKNYAMKGSDKCHIHGGKTPVKHGLYSKYTGQKLRDQVKAFAEDPELLDMRPQIAILVALTQQLLDKVEQQGHFGPFDADALATVAEKTTRAIERYIKVTEGTKHTIKIEHVSVIIEQIIQVANDTISDPKDKRRFAEGVAKLTVPGIPGNN